MISGLFICNYKGVYKTDKRDALDGHKGHPYITFVL